MCIICFLNNSFIISSGFLKFKIWIGQLTKLLRNSRIHSEFHSNLFTMTKHGLKNEIVKLNVKFFLWNFNQMIFMNFWRVRIRPCFQKSFWILFFYLSKFLCPMGTWLEYLNGSLFIWTLWVFHLGFPKWFQHIN
jgi:hypothetical protein